MNEEMSKREAIFLLEMIEKVLQRSRMDSEATAVRMGIHALEEKKDG